MTRTDMPTKDYLGEMKRCSHPKCRKLKDKSEFGVDCHNKDGLNHQCKECKNKRARANHKRKVEARFCKLNKPFFEYGDGYTKIRIDPNGDKYIILISSKYEHLSKEIPTDRAELLRDWLNVKLKKGKE